MQIGEICLIVLKENGGSTGYLWHAESDCPDDVSIESSYTPPSDTHGAVGVPGERLFTLEAMKPVSDCGI